MKFLKYIYIFFIMGTLFNLLLSFETTSIKVTLDEAIEQQLNKEQMQHLSPDHPPTGQSDDRFLRRKRRYLEFPEGSSFQLVYDLIVGVVDFTNYLILGVTVALAWELPSKPPSEIFDDIVERLKDGTLGTSRNDTVKNIKYIDLPNKATTAKSPINIYNYKLQPMFRPPMHYRYYTHRNPDNVIQKYPIKKILKSSHLYIPHQSNNWSRDHNRFDNPKLTHPFQKWIQTKKHPNFSVKGIKYPWWHLRERLKNSLISHSSIRRFDKNINYRRGQSPVTGHSDHRIYPVFGKRSATGQKTENKNLSSDQHRYRRTGIPTEHLSKWDRVHINHHRRTRHDLYHRIETYLNGRGSHGHHCVLRTLCETGQKSDEHQPGSFVGELMRVIFTLPEPLDVTVVGSPQLDNKELRYDAANALKDDCASHYSQCKESLWSSHFVL